MATPAGQALWLENPGNKVPSIHTPTNKLSISAQLLFILCIVGTRAFAGFSFWLFWVRLGLFPFWQNNTTQHKNKLHF